MAEVKLYTWEGKEQGMFSIPDALFAVEPKTSVVHAAIVTQDANSRVISAHVKGRGEVRGGGKKPWKQKGTGRARHGSTRSPIWIGGGVTHGPSAERNYSQKLNKKMKRLAIAMLLTDKLKNDAFVAVEDFSIPEAKTKHVAKMRKTLPGTAASALVITTAGDVNMVRAAKNMPKTVTISAQSVNPRDLAKYRYIVASKAAIAMMQETFFA